MINYEEMSDLVIDRKVFVAIYGECIGDKDMERVWREGKFRPCNNPSDAWSIIVESGITLGNYDGDNMAFCNFRSGVDEDLWDFMVVDKNPLRAAMICFLKMKDAEND